MFLKFGEEKFMKDLYNNGTIYLNPIQYFRKLEDGELRGDMYEGVSRIKNYPAGQFQIPSLNYTGSYLALQIRESYATVLGNIYSLYCISSHGWADPRDFSIDERNMRFGSHCVVIKDNVKFISLIKQKLKETKVKYHIDFVDYYDRNEVDRAISLFEKPLEFEYQKEFRIYVERFSDQPFVIQIGSLADIAELHNINDVIDTLELKVQ